VDDKRREALRQVITDRSRTLGMNISGFDGMHLQLLIKVLTMDEPWAPSASERAGIDPDGVWALIMPVTRDVLREEGVLNEANATAMQAFLDGK
jgi:hypothetical protein